MKLPGIRKIVLVVAALWFLGAAFFLTNSLLAAEYAGGLWPQLYSLAVTVLSPVSLMIWGWDKWKAGRDGRRVPERTLYLLALLGGWSGAVCGQQLFRHKTIKPVFRSVLASIVLLHICAVAVVAYRRLMMS